MSATFDSFTKKTQFLKKFVALMPEEDQKEYQPLLKAVDDVYLAMEKMETEFVKLGIETKELQ